MSRQKKLINKTNYPQHAIEKFARCVYPDIVAFYQSEEGQREFAEWQAEQAAKKAQRKLHTTKKEVTAAVTSVVILWAFSSVGLLAWKWEECGSRWGSRLARIARNKQIIRTHLPLGRFGSDYIGLVRATGLDYTMESASSSRRRGTVRRTVPFRWVRVRSPYQQKSTLQRVLFCWCGQQDSNLHALAVEPKSTESTNSTMPAYGFIVPRGGGLVNKGLFGWHSWQIVQY